MKERLFRHVVLTVLVAGLFATSVVPQQKTISQTAPSAERLRQHVTYLASDLLEGRRTGSPGANDAAHYIAGEFSQIGLRTAFQTIRNPKNRGEARSNYRQRFPYVAGVELGKTNNLTLRLGDTTVPVEVSKDWMPLGFTANAQLSSASAVYVGYGITASELKHDDYANAQLNGRIAIALSGTPDGDNPHGPFARYEDVRWKAIAARNAGAKALFIIAANEDFRQERLARLRYNNASGDAGLPVAVISGPAALVILKTTPGAFEAATKKAADQPAIPLQNLLIDLQTDVVKSEVRAVNLIGILDGSDPNLKNEAIIIGAHYDHLGHGGSGSLAPREGEIHHGADDNASGVAGMLELARLLTAQRPKPRRTIIFMAFGGEEEGLLGSNYYVNHPVVPLSNTIAMINLDMIGRMKNQSLIIGGIGTAEEWRSMVETANLRQGLTVAATTSADDSRRETANGVPLVVAANGRTIVTSDSSKQFRLTLNEDGFGPSDHSSFYGKQIPVLFFWTGTHEDYHKPSDTAEKINYEGEAQILSLVLKLVRDVAASDKRPTYRMAKTEATGRSTGFNVYLGTIPNYADTNEGLLLDGVRDDSPAAKAGVKAGDRIVKLAGREVRNVYDYTYLLGEMKAGQEYEVEVLRNGQRMKFSITPAPRR